MRIREETLRVIYNLFDVEPFPGILSIGNNSGLEWTGKASV